MMKILHDHNLTLNTGFKTPIHIRKYVIIESEVDSQTLPTLHLHNPYIIGGATNYLFVASEIDQAISYDGSSISIISDTQDHVIIRVEAGKNWHSFVMEMLNMQFYGLENLVLIPGTVGAAPVQNIGAYGREVGDFIIAVHGINIYTGEQFQLSRTECLFSYRHSIFKTTEWKNMLITHVDFHLSKIDMPIAKYPDVEQYLTDHGIEQPNAQDIAYAIIEIRNRKLPNPDIVGNAGSFFKNPIISREQYIQLQHTFPDIPCYAISDLEVKIPAGWLIDKAGWKGFRHQGASVHDKQALVLINADDALGKDIYALSMMIQNSVSEQYGISLEPEVNIIL